MSSLDYGPDLAEESGGWMSGKTRMIFQFVKKKKTTLDYRAVLFKWEFIIQMRDAVSQPSIDIEESYFSKNTLFLFKNDFLFYYRILSE